MRRTCEGERCEELDEGEVRGSEEEEVRRPGGAGLTAEAAVYRQL